MSADPAELMFYREMTADTFFEEAEKLGVSVEELQDEETYDQVFYSCLVNIRVETAKAVAKSLNIAITDDQANAIARNSLVPEVSTEPVPLTPEEREIADTLYYHAIKAAAARHGESIEDSVARIEAKKMTRTGERGLTLFQKFGRTSGCLVVIAVLLLGTASAAASVACICR